MIDSNVFQLAHPGSFKTLMWDEDVSDSCRQQIETVLEKWKIEADTQRLMLNDGDRY